MKPLHVHYDGDSDELTINGVVYSGQVFRTLALAEPGTWLRIAERDKAGVLQLTMVNAKTESMFDAMTGQGRFKHKV